MDMRIERLTRFLGSVMLVCLSHLLAPAQAADADSYPSRPLRLLIPFPTGGSNDVVGRVVGALLGERLGRPVVVDNRGGAGGVIGTELAAKSDPDGYTVLFISSAFSASVSLYKLPYDPAKTFNERLIAHMADQKPAKATTHKVSSNPPFPEEDDEPDEEQP